MLNIFEVKSVNSVTILSNIQETYTIIRKFILEVFLFNFNFFELSLY